MACTIGTVVSLLVFYHLHELLDLSYGLMIALIAKVKCCTVLAASECETHLFNVLADRVQP